MLRTHEITAYAQQLILEYNRARKLLRKYFKKRHNPDEALAKIKEIIDNMAERQSKIIGYTLNDAFRKGAKEGSREISNATISVAASSASMGFDLTKVADAHLKNITQSNIGHIGKYNSALTKQLQLQYDTLLADNKLVSSLSKNGWTPWLDKALEKRGVSAEVIALAKGQTTTKKIIDILEMEGIRGGKHPREVSKMLLPHIQRHFGPDGVVIDNVGKFKKVLKVDADGNFKYVKQAVTRPYRATHKSYSNLLARSSMIQAHHEGRYQSLQKTGLVDHYISVSVLDANTCDHCAMMHGQRVLKGEGPLYHPSCACNLKPIWKKDSGLKNKDPAIYGKQRDQHFWKQQQLADYNKNMPKGAKLKFHSMLPKDALTAMPDKDAMRTIRYNALGKPGAITPKTITKGAGKPQIIKEDKFIINTPLRETRNKLAPFDVTQNSSGKLENIKFTGHERYALEKYKGEQYIAINNHLRGKPIPDYINPLEDVSGVIKDLDSALKKSKLPSDIITYRGVSPNVAKRIMEKNVCTDLGFSSTSFRPDGALGFASRGGDGFKNVMIFKGQKGTNALMWPEYESEILFEKGLKLKCIKIQEVNKLTVEYSAKKTQRLTEPHEKIRLFIMEMV